ncbi:protein of unknown function [Candidatus Hydrogenisulfobacillus filiaventi]|uniref:Uncharacterized protein n=1 Tax=Candidatus Hydrogenisulfobacillus filiaventi TaxID=2707344 RepID=A0A6F8ZIL3_9FIRM|nr:protein of unknown function [Candidatus Hydrogenisulfobacillus filiaventi]
MWEELAVITSGFGGVMALVWWGLTRWPPEEIGLDPRKTRIPRGWRVIRGRRGGPCRSRITP